jgi:hypothetical protein
MPGSSLRLANVVSVTLRAEALSFGDAQEYENVVDRDPLSARAALFYPGEQTSEPWRDKRDLEEI